MARTIKLKAAISWVNSFEGISSQVQELSFDSDDERCVVLKLEGKTPARIDFPSHTLAKRFVRSLRQSEMSLVFYPEYFYVGNDLDQVEVADPTLNGRCHLGVWMDIVQARNERKLIELNTKTSFVELLLYWTRKGQKVNSKLA